MAEHILPLVKPFPHTLVSRFRPHENPPSLHDPPLLIFHRRLQLLFQLPIDVNLVIRFDAEPFQVPVSDCLEDRLPDCHLDPLVCVHVVSLLSRRGLILARTGLIAQGSVACNSLAKGRPDKTVQPDRAPYREEYPGLQGCDQGVCYDGSSATSRLLGCSRRGCSWLLCNPCWLDSI
ncbi:uncharacterized protein P174DRAFT_3155 [Aspergillus novofumigatus IBT 16806]|uniref:Uncharacterized protein n=1 Tax=Aspergillus novofumigatus (strain IBT 16806) TaxID=1392255 RepID=A0A2I1CKB4_ASPN1|nr:uncharacterized protein P174DRAFT_3155 [Aspergillus novofumigatus IBT 16806]PKX98069.1 hypothetical protein P174DRAFT_3155 [Aspergillus novofumigatus IBT 16806]